MAVIDMTKAFQDKKPIQTIASVSHTNWQQVDYPAMTKKITVGCAGSAMYLSFSYSDGDAASTVDAAEVAAGAYFEIKVQDGLDSVCLLGKGGAAANVVVCVEQS